MKYSVKVKPRSSKNDVVIKDDLITVFTVKSPVDNEANTALVELLSEKFNLSKSRIKIISGLKSRNKIVEIL